MGILAFLLLGILAGAIAKSLMPGDRAGGWFATLLLGVVGAVVGGWIAGAIFGVGLGGFFNLRTWVVAILGSVLVLWIYGAMTGRR